MSAGKDCGLIIFLRMPEKGKVKTRLAQIMGDAQALAIYRELTSLTLIAAVDSGLPVYLFYSGGLPGIEDRISSFNYHHQIGGNLGEKMLDAFSIVLALHSRAIIIGSDCPLLTGRHIATAGELLDEHDLVIGPTDDGGYYLLGCSKLYPELFKDKSWSSDIVFEQTMDSIRKLNLTCADLQKLRDVDTADDWTWYKNYTS